MFARNAIAVAVLALVCVAFGRGVDGVKVGMKTNGSPMCEIGSFKPTASDYVQSGLVAMWDGIENVAYGSNDKSSRSWIDLVGGKTFALYAAATWNSKGIENKSGAIAHGDGFSIEDDDIVTIECVFYGHEIYRAAQNVIGLNTSTGKRILIWDNGPTIVLSNSNSSRYGNFGIIQNSENYSVSAIYSNGSILGYKNGVAAQNNGVMASHSQYQYLIGTYNGGNAFPVKGTICCIRVYNRVLSQNEISFNHQIDVKRFGID